MIPVVVKSVFTIARSARGATPAYVNAGTEPPVWLP
jgi:hypothetical protein